jgi:Bacterial Ig-like domain (group 3)
MAFNLLSHRSSRRRSKSKSEKRLKKPRLWKPVIELLEERAVPTSGTVSTFGANAQHTSLYAGPSQDMNQILWKTPVDLDPQYDSGGELLIHYGSPLVTAGNTVIVPVKTGATGGFRLDFFSGDNGGAASVGGTGVPKFSLTTDYILPSHDWTPSYSPTLASDGAGGTRLYYAGAGGTVYYIENPDSSTAPTPVQEAFYGLTNYQGNTSSFNSTVFIDTPITADSSGDIFFGFRVQGTAPIADPVAHTSTTTQSGFARIDPNGNGTYILASAAANGDSNISQDVHNSAPALSNDGQTLYVVVKANGGTFTNYGYLVALNASNMHFKDRVFLDDPRPGLGAAAILDDSTSSPMVAPDGTVFIGVFDARNPNNGDVVTAGDRGWTLHFSSDLATEFTPAAYGWDYTDAIVPASMVPSYHGTSSYLLFSKYQNYAAPGSPASEDWGDGLNKIAILDPNATQVDPHPGANGLLEMREVMTAIGPTPDPGNVNATTSPNAVREWCINTAAVDEATDSIIVPSEDGNVYRWDLATDSLSQTINVGTGIGEAYVPTIINPNNGQILTINNAELFAIGSVSGVGIDLTSSTPSHDSVVVGQTLTFTATITDVNHTGHTPTGTVTFLDALANGTTPPPASTLAASVTLNASGQATYSTSSLAAGNHFISIDYSGDSNFSKGSIELVQDVHASATTTTLTSSPSPTLFGTTVTFTATVTPTTSGLGAPTGMVLFTEGNTVLWQAGVNSSGNATFTTSSLSLGRHTVTATYHSDPIYASSQGSDSASPQVVNASTATTVTVPSGTVFFGQVITYTATVSNTVTTGAPTGTVTFTILNGTTTLNSGSGTLSAINSTQSQAKYVTTGNMGGITQTVSAKYNGDTNFSSSGPTTGTNLITAANTKTTVSVMANNLFFAGFWYPVATVRVVPGQGAGTPGSPGLGAAGAGTVTFKATILTNASASNTFVLGGTFTETLGTSSVNANGQASVGNHPFLPGNLTVFNSSGTPTSLTTAAYTITATFNATGADFASSPASAGVVENVNGNVATTTQVSASPLSPAPQVGQKVTLTATVTAGGGSRVQPIGSVTFMDTFGGGTSTLGTVNLPVAEANGVNKGTATFTTTSLAKGTHSLSAVYNPDATTLAPDFTSGTGFTSFATPIRGQWLGSTSTNVNFAVNPITTFGSLSANPTSQGYGRTVIFTDNVTSSTGAVPIGLVQFEEGGTTLGASSLGGGGRAFFSTNTLSAGTHLIRAVYNASGNFVGDTSNTLSYVVTKVTTSTKLTDSSQVITRGTTVTFTGTVSGVPVTPPTGSVVFVVESNARTAANQSPAGSPTTLGTATLSGGVATLPVAFNLTPDIYEIEAFYNGDINNIPSHSPTVNPAPAPGPRGFEEVVKDTASALITPTPTSGTGSSVTFTTYVRPSAQGTSLPLTAATGGFGGTVTLNVDGTDIVTRPVLSLTGLVTLTDSNISIGAHLITITYNGDAGNPTVLGSVGYPAYPAGTEGWLPGTSTIFTYTRTSVVPPNAVLGTAPQSHASTTSVQGTTSPKSTTTPLTTSSVDGYFASTTTRNTTRTLAGALAKVHSNDDWLAGGF